MGNNEFDDLMRMAVGRRCEQPMPEAVSELISRKRRSGARMRWAWVLSAAAAVAAAIVIVPAATHHVSPADQPGSAPAFFVEAKAQTESRLVKAASASEQLRHNIDELYMSHQ